MSSGVKDSQAQLVYGDASGELQATAAGGVCMQACMSWCSQAHRTHSVPVRLRPTPRLLACCASPTLSCGAAGAFDAASAQQTSHVTRRLAQDAAFTDFLASPDGLGKKAAAFGDGAMPGMGSSYVPTKRVETAKLLVGPKLAAAIEFPTYAFASDRFTGESNVSVALASSSAHGPVARFSLGFGYCEAGLYYDPTIYFAGTEDMVADGPDAAAAAAAGALLPTGAAGNATAACRRGDAECARARRRERPVGAGRNAACERAASGMLPALASAASGLLLLLMAL
jgi:hypothetical protein